MTWWLTLLLATVALYAAFVVTLIVAGRQRDARAVAGLIPDCLVLIGRLLRDDRVPRRRKVVLVAILGYLASPIDLIPDFIPVAGQLDDAIAVAFVLRLVLRAGGPQLLDEHWPGPVPTRDAIRRLAYGSAGKAMNR